MHTGNWLNKHQPFWLKLLKKFCKLRWCIVVLKIWNERLIKRCSGYYYFHWRTSTLVQVWEKVTTRDRKSSHRDHKSQKKCFTLLCQLPFLLWQPEVIWAIPDKVYPLYVRVFKFKRYCNHIPKCVSQQKCLDKTLILRVWLEKRLMVFPLIHSVYEECLSLRWAF